VPITTADIKNWVQRCGPYGDGLSAVLDEIAAGTDLGGTIDPADPAQLGPPWNSVALRYLQSGSPRLAMTVYRRAVDHLIQLQRKHDRRFHKGMFLHNLANGHFAAGEPDAAFWFHRLAFVEDVLSRAATDSTRPETPATGALRLFHGVSDIALDAWVAQAGHAAKLDQTDPEQRIQARYPELAVVDAARNEAPEAAPLGARTDLPVNRLLVEDLDALLDIGDANARGISLERLTAYLCLTLPGARIANRVRTKIGELDLIVVLRDAAPSYFIESLGRTLLVECKNWDKPAGVQEVNHFASRIRLHGCRAGILVATSSVSGARTRGEGLTFGQLLIQGWFHQDGVVVCVIDRDGIRALGAKHRTFSDLVLDRFDQVRFAYSDSTT